MKRAPNVQPRLSEDDMQNGNVERSLQEINAENASRRITEKSGKQPIFVGHRDAAQDARTVFVGNVALSVEKKVNLHMIQIR